MSWYQSFLNGKLNIFNINIKNIKDKSSVSLNVFNNHNINRQKLNIGHEWFESLLKISYDDEIKSKYIPELNTISNIEETHFQDIIDYRGYLFHIFNQIKICNDYISRFKKSQSEFEILIKDEQLKILENNTELKSIILLKSELPEVCIKLSELEDLLNNISKLLNTDVKTINVPLLNRHVNHHAFAWQDFVNKEPSNLNVFMYLFKHYKQVFLEIDYLNLMLERHNSKEIKIIIGDAGVGKTHFCANLIQKIKKNNEYVIFFKPKQFNGDNVELNERLLSLLQIPKGFIIQEVFTLINNYVKSQNKRCFILIDALNETTKDSIGFSNIWRHNLQEFINLIKQYSHLQFICTLRRSYIDNIWNVKPAYLIEIKGFKIGELKHACLKYFKYYNIKPINIDNADLALFENPLLLSLYCNFIKSYDKSEMVVELNMQTYLNVFENYIARLISEVRKKLELEKEKPIIKGFEENCRSFYNKNEAILSLDEFVDSFDPNDFITHDKSVARAVLEGYLIFIKDYIAPNLEIIKHTQQEVGGYLLAKYLVNIFPDLDLLIKDVDFQNKILIEDAATNHQLKLDILKFIIALKPEVITKISGKDSLKLSWWYLYNGYSGNESEISDFLITNEGNLSIFGDIFDLSCNYWFDTKNHFNFQFLSRLLDNMDRWTYDITWTFYIYKKQDFFFELIEKGSSNLQCNDSNYLKLVAKFIAYLLSTTVRDLRDMATLFLVEYGKIYPTDLLKLTIEFVNHVDIYIYERLVCCCYGLCLIKQNDSEFIEEYLYEYTATLYKLQFDSNSSDRVLNYIVIDSIKHLTDLGVNKNIFHLGDLEKNELKNYCFKSFPWNKPTKQQKDQIRKSGEMNRPPPLGMDFGIYTIPRLVDGYKEDFKSMTNIYAKIFEDGYVIFKNEDFQDELFKNFYFGYKISSHKGKIDRLGKKYSWNAFFSYAGQLLQTGKLDVFENVNEVKYYRRLSDVNIDISFPNIEYEIKEEIFKENLLSDRSENIEWYKKIFIDETTKYIEYPFDNDEYLLLNGFVDQRLDDEYKVRSLLIFETVFIDKNEIFEKINEISKDTLDWDCSINVHNDHIRSTYFGEIYWGDSVFQNSKNYVQIPTGKTIDYEKNLSIQDIMVSNKEYKFEDIGKVVVESDKEYLSFEAEATLADFSWETDSGVLEGLHEKYPSIRMAKKLNLISEPSTGNILDKNLQSCYKCVDYKDGYNSQSFNYMKKQLLKDYMVDNNFALLYQIKQHSYDKNFEHTRKLKFFIFDF